MNIIEQLRFNDRSLKCFLAQLQCINILFSGYYSTHAGITDWQVQTSAVKHIGIAALIGFNVKLCL